MRPNPLALRDYDYDCVTRLVVGGVCCGLLCFAILFGMKQQRRK